MDNSLTMGTYGLTSKWGFNDGDVGITLIDDWDCEERGTW